MKKFILVLSVMIGLISCTKEYNLPTPTQATSNLRVNGKPGKTYTIGKGRYKTIQSVYSVLQANDIVIIPPGNYDEQLVLKSDVTFQLDNANIVFTEADVPGVYEKKPTVITTGGVTNCTITGTGTFGRSNSSARVVEITDNSQVSMITANIKITDNNSTYGTIFVGVGSNLSLTGDIHSKKTCVVAQGTFTGAGTLTSDEENGLWLANSNAVVNFKGTCYAKNQYSAGVQVASGNLTFEGTSISDGYFGLEKSGGTALIKNSVIESKSTQMYLAGGSAISNYGGEDLSLDNVTLKVAATDGVEQYGIAGMGRPFNVTLLSTCFSNKGVNSDITLNNPSLLIVQ